MTSPATPHDTPSCRLCGASLRHTFVDLGMSPLCQRHVEPDALGEPETFYPLHAFVCGDCFLVQLPEHAAPDEIFTDYAYFSSYSVSWLDHARRFTDWAAERFSLAADSRVVELASNDGYLLQYFREKDIPVLGVEPAANVAQAAVDKGIPTHVAFFGVRTALEVAAVHGRADLIVGNNVLAHVPDLNDFINGIQVLLAPGGVISMEFPHLLRLMDENQFDTIYHEHYSYFSFSAAQRAFDRHGLTIFDVQELPTHGGSLRILARHADNPAEPVTESVRELRQREIDRGLDTLDAYTAFADQVRRTKRKLLGFLINAKNSGKSVVGYGAPGKGNTLLNYCGIGADFLDYTVDRSPHKQGRFLPGTRIPILAPEHIAETKPDYVLILPWNLQQEITRQMAHIHEWGGRFVVPIPEARVLEPCDVEQSHAAPAPRNDWSTMRRAG